MKTKYCLHVSMMTTATQHVVLSQAHVSFIYFLFPSLILEDIRKMTSKDREMPEGLKGQELIITSVVRVVE